MNRLLRYLFFSVVVKPVVMIVLGLNVRHRERLPKRGPAIILANHNSHLDTRVLMTLLPEELLPIVQPVAARDYFLRNPLLAWFAQRIIGILPINRKPERRGDDPLAPCYGAISSGRILIFFPEGSRGKPEQISRFKGGIARLSEKFPDIPVVPVLLHGLGKALPKGEGLLVPFFCDVFVGESLFWPGERKEFMEQLEERMNQLSDEGRFPVWE